MARAPVSKTGGWGFESLHSCQRFRAFSFERNWNAMGLGPKLDHNHPRAPFDIAPITAAALVSAFRVRLA